MLYSEEDLQEFIRLCEEEDGRHPSREEAEEAATRLILMYRHLLFPTAVLREAARLATSGGDGTLSSGPVEPEQQSNTTNALLPLRAEVDG